MLDISTSQSVTSPSRANLAVVKSRRGGKYADIILNQLMTEAFTETASPSVGIVSLDGRQYGSTMAANLAIRAADHHLGPALLVDANYCNSRLTKMYRCDDVGLCECFQGTAAIEECVKSTKIENMSALGLGKAKLAKQIVMNTDNINEFFVAQRRDYRFSVYDLPVLDEPSIANILLRHLDGILIVAKYGSRKEHIQRLQKQIEDNGSQVLGVVMTGQESKLPRWLSYFF